MRYITMTILMLFMVAANTKAQERMSVGAGLVISLPMGDFGDAANTGIGGTAAFEMPFTPQLRGVGNIGYITWSTDVDDYSFSAVPVTAGIKYYFMQGSGFYGLGQLGLYFVSFNTPEFEFGGVSYDNSDSSTEFAFILGAGYEIPVSATVVLDFTGAFNIISDMNNLSIRGGAKVAL